MTTRDEVIAMAREADSAGEVFGVPVEWLERFAALVEQKKLASLASDVSIPEPLMLMVPSAQESAVLTADQLRDYGDRRAAAERNEATRKCDSRSQSLHNDGNHVAANEAHKCGSAIGGARRPS